MSEDATDSDVDVFDVENALLPSSSDPRWLDLPGINMLSLEDADAFLRWRAASLVAIVGERNGGKTTLVAELYERFLRGPFGGHLFWQCCSLHGFERKNFLSRAMSGAERPDTPRTSKLDGLAFFHLGLFVEAGQRHADLLISERAGEFYRGVRDRPSNAHDLIEVQKAQVVVFVLDGERVADSLKRSEAMASVRNIVRALLGTGVLSSRTRAQLVTTKWDLLQGDALAEARHALGTFEAQMSELLRTRVETVSIHRVSARDPKGQMDPAYGMAELLEGWTQTPCAVPASKPPTPPLADEFDRLLIRSLNV